MHKFLYGSMDYLTRFRTSVWIMLAGCVVLGTNLGGRFAI
jgi:hypothetical protein